MVRQLVGSAAAGLRRAGIGALALLLPGLVLPAQPRAEPVDLELILAVDTSLSVSNEEFLLQIHGLSQAFRHEAVAAAIRAAGDRGIAVTLVQWSDRNQQRVTLGWTRLRDRASILAFAERLARTRRTFEGAGTAIARALESCLLLFRDNGYEGERRVIDISGDGIDNRGPLPFQMRDLVVAAGVTVNGLAILNEDAYLDRYFERNVIGGTGAFVMTAADYQDFAVAILRKLVREISEQPLASLPDAMAGTLPRAPAR